jgi:hypothetical protein
VSENYAAEVRDFYDFLDEHKPAHFVSSSLTTILRTEPPLTFGPTGVADMVAGWAEERAARTGERLSDLLLGATRAIVDAYNIDAIAHFRPRDFYRPYRARLIALCPEREGLVLEAALDALQSSVPQRGQRLSASELARVAGSDPRRDLDAAAEQQFDEALDRIRQDPHQPEPQFAEGVAAVERYLGDPERVPTQPALLRVIDAATALFNGAAVARAGRLFSLVDEALSQPGVAEVRRKDARSGLRRRSLDETIFVQWVNDSRRRVDVAPIVRFFEDLEADQLLGALLVEKVPARTQLLMNTLDAHGVGAVPVVLDHLANSEAAPMGDANLTGLVMLIGRHGAGSDLERRRAIDVVGPLLTAPDASLRAAAVLALDRLGGREVVPHALRAIEADAYRVEPQGDEAKRHLEGVMGLLVTSGLDSAVAVVASTATGERDGGFGRLGKSLRDAALAALARRSGPLPRRAALVLAEALRGMAKRRFGFFSTGALGGDPELVARLANLLDDSPEPEAREVLALPAFRKLAARDG